MGSQSSAKINEQNLHASANSAFLQQQVLMAQMQQNQSKDDEINLAELWRAIWAGKLTIILISFIFAIASIYFALSKPNIYKASIILAPASNESGAGGLSALAGQFGGLASMAGINLAGGESGKTDAGGVYTFSDVDVINVAGVNNEGDESDDTVGAALTLTVVGPEGYLGGTITITPEAQVNNTGGQGDSQDGGNSDVTAQTFVSGHNYGAGKAVLPALTAKVTGYLTDCSKSYTSYDQVIEGAVVAADILSLGSSATETATPGSSFELSTKDLSATTGADGMFTITLPADSVVNLLADGWGLDSDGVAPVDALDSDELASTNVIVANQTSNHEQITQNIGIIEVCPFATPDTTVPNVAPMFSSIDGQTSLMVDAGYDDAADETVDTAADNATFVGLDEGVVNDFAINFSEALPN
jgi:hypothetical protein